MSAAHTPGPWGAVPMVNGSKGGFYIVGNRHGNNAETEVATVGPTLSKSAEANARLIAAAPALLEALEDARTSLSITRTNIMCEIGRCADPSESRWEGVPEQLAKRIAKIDAAISLARGESA